MSRWFFASVLALAGLQGCGGDDGDGGNSSGDGEGGAAGGSAAGAPSSGGAAGAPSGGVPGSGGSPAAFTTTKDLTTCEACDALNACCIYLNVKSGQPTSGCEVFSKASCEAEADKAGKIVECRTAVQNTCLMGQ